MKKTVIILGAFLLFGNAVMPSNFNSKNQNQIEFSLYGKSPLHLAISKGDIEAVRSFVKYGADLNKIVNNMTPLMVAARFNKFEIIEILLKNGARPQIENNQGFTALHYAQYAKSYEAIAILKKVE